MDQLTFVLQCLLSKCVDISVLLDWFQAHLYLWAGFTKLSMRCFRQQMGGCLSGALTKRADPLCRSKCTTFIGLLIVLSEVRLCSFRRDILNVINNKSHSTPMSGRRSSGSSWWESPFYSPFPGLLTIPEHIVLPAVPAQDHFTWKLTFCSSPPIRTGTVMTLMRRIGEITLLLWPFPSTRRHRFVSQDHVLTIMYGTECQVPREIIKVCVIK